MSEHELWNELGNLYFMSGAYDQAVYAYHRSIQMEAAFGRPYSNLALTYVQQGRYEEAVELYRKSLDLLTDDREKAVSWSRLGNVYRQLKNYQEAVLAYQQADAMDPEGSETRAASDNILYGSPNVSISHEELLALTQSVPNHEQVDLTQVHTEEAITSSLPEETLPLDAVTSVSWAALESAPLEAPAVLEAEEMPQTVTDEAAVEMQEPDLEQFFEDEDEEGVYFPELDAELIGEWLPIPEPLEPEKSDANLAPAGDEELSPVLNEAPVDVTETWPQTAEIVPAGQDEPVSAAAEAETREPVFQIVEIDTESSPDVYLMSNPPAAEPSVSRHSEEMALNLELEIPKLKKLVQINPRNSVTWNTLGNLYKSAGQYKDAIMAYQQATSLDPGKAEYYHNLAMVYGAEGRDEDAIISLQKVLELKPDHSLTHATLGGYYQKMGLEELAQKHIGKAMKHIYDSESEYNRACLEAICGNTDQAIDLLRVALENKQTYVDWVLRDPDLDMIREDRRFKQLISDFT